MVWITRFFLALSSLGESWSPWARGLTCLGKVSYEITKNKNLSAVECFPRRVLFFPVFATCTKSVAGAQPALSGMGAVTESAYRREKKRGGRKWASNASPLELRALRLPDPSCQDWAPRVSLKRRVLHSSGFPEAYYNHEDFRAVAITTSSITSATLLGWSLLKYI